MTVATHSGRCHCGAVAFEVDTDLEMVMECNCTHCFRTGVWLTFVLVYDMALLGVLVADQGRVLSGAAVNVLLLFNPTDAYRMLNLAGSGAARAVSGMVGATGGADLGPAVLLPVLVGWVAIPLILASLIFSRREL